MLGSQLPSFNHQVILPLAEQQEVLDFMSASQWPQEKWSVQLHSLAADSLLEEVGQECPLQVPTV